MPNFVNMTNGRRGDLLPGERVAAACPFVSSKALIRWIVGASGPEAGSTIGAAVSPVGGVVGGVAAAALATVGLKRFVELSDDDRLTTGGIELPHFVIVGVTDRALLFWRYQPGMLGSDLLKELLYRVPFTAVSAASRRRQGTGWYLSIEFVDGATFVAEAPPAYPRRARRVITELERATASASAPATPTALDWNQFRARPPSPKPPPTKRAKAAAVALLAVMGAGLIVGGVIAIRDGGAPSPPMYTDHYLAGTVTVTEFSVVTTPDGPICAGTGASIDLAESTKITVTDTANTVLASASLHAGVPVRADAQNANASPTSTTTPGQTADSSVGYVGCTFKFFITSRLPGAPAYRFNIGTRPPHPFTYEELDQQGWRVSL